MNKRIPDKHLQCPSPLINDFADYLSQSAIRYVPQFSLQASINFFGHLFGRKVIGDTNLKTGIYSLFIGESGGGKGYCKQAINALDETAIYRNVISDATSESAIRTGFVHDGPNMLVIMDEFGDKFTSKNENNVAVRAAIRELYNENLWIQKRFSGFTGGEIREKQKICNIKHPCLNFMGFSTLEQITGGMTDSDIESGTLNRFIIVDVKKDEIIRNRHGMIDCISDDLRNRVMSISTIENHLTDDNNWNSTPVFEKLPFEDGTLDWLNDKHDELMDGKNSKYQVRTIEKVMRLSLIIAYADKKKVIPKEYVEWCYEYIWFWTYNTKTMSESAGVTGYSISINKFLAKLKSKSDNGWTIVSMNDYFRRTLSFKPFERDGMLKDLEDDKIIEKTHTIPKDSKNGKKVYFYVYKG